MGKRKTRYPGIVALGDGKYFVTARVRVNGRVVARQATITGTLEQARARFEELKKAIRDAAPGAGSLTLPSVSTFGDILTIYRERRGELSPPDKSRCDRIERDLGAVPLNEFSARFEKYLKIIRVTATKKTGRPPSNAAVNRIIELVKAVFNLAVKLELMPASPITAARFPKLEVKPRDRYLTEEERLRLFNAIRKHAPYLEPFVRYSLMVPCRKGELINLPREAYNAITNTIYVPDSKAGVPIYKPVPDEMKAYFRNIPAGCPYLFYRQGRDGKYYPLGDFKKAWRTCLKLAGISNCRVHDLRHCAASDLVVAGNSERVIMDIAGWKTPMLSTYWHKNSLRSAQMIRFPGECEGVVNGLKAGNG